MKSMSDMLPGIAANIKEESTAQLEKPVYKVAVIPGPADTINSGPVRYLVTSERFTGKAEMLYLDGVLQDVKMMETNMKPAQRHAFKCSAPVLESQLRAFWEHTGVGVIKAEYEISFEQFWNDYHKTLNVPKEHKERALKEWSLLDAGDRLRAWVHIKEYKAFLDLPRNRGRGIKNADTYLKVKPWRSE